MSDPVASPSDNRFTIVTPDDRSGVIWIVTILCATYSALLLPIRWVIKKKVLGADDYVFTAALVSRRKEETREPPLTHYSPP